jgi:amino acid transporter
LRRAVSRWQIVGFSLNDVVGSGVYLLPAEAAILLGAASLWAVGLAGLAVFLLVLCFAEASSRFDEPGSAYLYAKTAFGDLAGFEVGWMAWLTRVASVASLSVGFAQALSFLVPAAGGGLGKQLAIALPLLALTVINLIGVESGMRAAVFLVLTKIIPLLVFVGAGVFAFSPETFAGQAAASAEPGTNPLGEAALLLLFAYAGFENTPAPAGEFKNPKRDVPFALLVQIGLVTLLYFAVQAVALGTLPNVAASKTPLADAARGFLGNWGGWLLTVGGALSILGTNSNTVLAGPRYLYALAKGGFGPIWLTDRLAWVHPRWQTPAVAILVQTAIALPLALTGSFVQLAALSAVTRLAVYFATALSVPVLRRKMADRPAGFTIPGGPLVPAAAVLVTLVLASAASARNLIAAAIALVVGYLLYTFRGHRQSSM